ncbi:MAG: WD40/YVTN/BNR-like repeat-containing protein [Caldilineaceae bacterium]
MTVVENGPTVAYTVALCSKPTRLVTVTLQVSAFAREQLTIEPADDELLFDETDWNKGKRVEITAINDSVAEPSRVITIGHVLTSADPNFVRSENEAPVVTVEIIDDDKGLYLPLASRSLPPAATPTPISTPQAQWQSLTTNPPHVDVIAVNNNHLFAGDRSDDTNTRGIYRTSSCAIGATFAKLQGNVRVQDFAFSGQFGIAATNGDRIYYSINDGTTWQRTNSPMNQFVFAVAIIDIGQAYAGADDGVYRSSDNGATWSKVSPAGGNGPTLINAFTYADNILWIGTQGGGVWKLTPGSNQFTQVIGGLTNPDTDLRVWDILRRNATEYYIATTNGVYTGNGTGNWSPFGLQGLQVLSLELIDNTLYAGVRDGGVRRKLLDGSSDWIQESGITPTNLTVRDLFYDQSGLCKALLAGTTNGIWIYR